MRWAGQGAVELRRDGWLPLELLLCELFQLCGEDGFPFLDLALDHSLSVPQAQAIDRALVERTLATMREAE